MKAFAFHSAAFVELGEAVEYYRAIDEDLARRLRVEVAALTERIVRRPRQYPRVPKTRADARWALLTGFPYAIVFAERTDSILVLAFAHQRRMPGYWASRARRDD